MRRLYLTARIFLKLILGVLLVLIVALTAVDFLASHLAERNYVQTLNRELVDKAHILGFLGPPDWARVGAADMQKLAGWTGGRLTVIAADGRVVADSEASPAQMENHSGRPEVAAALNGRAGSDTRQSSTVGVNFLYVAIPLQGGALRLAVPLKEIESQVDELREQLLASVVIAFLPAILVAALFAKYVSSKLAAIIEYAGKLARGDFRARLAGKGRDELGILTVQLNETGEKLEKMFQEQQREHEQLEKMERVRKDFLINVSHELRTPLASIQGYTETLLEGALHDPDHNVRFLTIIRQNAERLGRMIADIMTLTRIELKNTRFQFASYHVNAIVEECADSMLPMAEKKQIEIHVEPSPEETEVFCDSEAVHQIITNLLDNALKYTPEGGRIVLGTIPVSGNRNMLEVYVKDTGIGIPSDDLPRLFERFYRVDKARSREMGGTGLGLAIVKHLVRAMGGEVRVESRLNEGSTFIFSLPVRKSAGLNRGKVQAELTIS